MEQLGYRGFNLTKTEYMCKEFVQHVQRNLYRPFEDRKDMLRWSNYFRLNSRKVLELLRIYGYPEEELRKLK